MSVPMPSLNTRAEVIMERRIGNDTELFIDALRGIAALWVLLTHAVDLGIARVYGWELLDNPVGWRWVRAIFGHGAFAVWAFFIISGLCIHQSIQRSIACGNFSWRRYTLARVTRIYPLFLIGLALAVLTWFLTVGFQGDHGRFPWPQFGASLFMLHGLTASFPAYDPSWSLSNEMIYYVAWPAALLLCGGSGNRAARFSMIGALLISTGILGCWKIFHRMETSTAVEGVWTLAVLFPIWIAGAWLMSNWEEMRKRVSARVWLLFIPLCLASVAVLAVVRFKGDYSCGLNTASLTCIPGLMLLIAGGHHLRLSSCRWAGRVCGWLGRFSYPSYILHYQIMLLIDCFWLSHEEGAFAHRPLLRAFLLLVPTLFVTAIFGPMIESRIMAWRARLLAKSSSGSYLPAGRIN